MYPGKSTHLQALTSLSSIPRAPIGNGDHFTRVRRRPFHCGERQRTPRTHRLNFSCASEGASRHRHNPQAFHTLRRVSCGARLGQRSSCRSSLSRRPFIVSHRSVLHSNGYSNQNKMARFDWLKLDATVEGSTSSHHFLGIPRSFLALPELLDQSLHVPESQKPAYKGLCVEWFLGTTRARANAKAGKSAPPLRD